MLLFAQFSQAQLNGSYTIDPGSGQPNNYTSFGAAITDLTQMGITGPVEFLVASGTYNEQLAISSISGVSATNKVTFRSANGNNASVIIQYSASSSSSNYVLQLNNVSYVFFKKMSFSATGSTYSRVIEFSGGASYNMIDSCIIQTSNLTTSTNSYGIYSDGSANTKNTISNNDIIGGESGIHWYGASGNLKDSTIFFANNISEFYTNGIDCKYASTTTISSNYIEVRGSANSGSSGIVLSETTGACDIIKNHIVMSTSGLINGIKLLNCTANSSDYGLVANNFSSCQTSGTSSIYGYYIYGATYYDILANSANLTGGGTGSAALYQHYGSNTSFINNIFINNGTGYSFYASTTSAIFNADYNCLYTTGTYLANWGGSKTDLAALQTASGKFANSLQHKASFISSTDLHVNDISLNGTGTNISASVSDDFDGEARNNPPDIGADEFTLIPMDIGVSELNAPFGSVTPGSQDFYVSLTNYDTTTLTSATLKCSIGNLPTTTYNWTGNLLHTDTAKNILIATKVLSQGIYTVKTWSENPNNTFDNINFNDTILFPLYVCNPMTGNYTIGGASPDFATFNDAIEMLNNCGVSGPVTFYVNNGVYNEQLIFSTISGVSATNHITFIPTNSNSVQIQYTGSGPQDAATILFDSARYITLTGFAIKALGSIYGEAVSIIHHSNNITIDSNILEVNGTSANQKVVKIETSSYITLKNNELRNGSIGIEIFGTQSSQCQGNYIYNNLIDGFANTGIKSRYSTSNEIIGNSIENMKSASDVDGMYLKDFHGASQIIKNYIHISTLSANSTGVHIINSNASSGYEALIVNNAIVVDSGAVDIGLLLDTCEYFNVYFNTLLVHHTTGNSTAFKASLGSYINLVDNIIANTGTGYSININSNTSIVTASHNCLYSTGSNLSFYTSINSDLAALQSTSGKFANSIVELPNFISFDNPHLLGKLSSQGTPITGITKDFDGDLRSAVAPDMGGDEYTQLANDGGLISIYSEDSCEGEQEIWINLVNYGTNAITNAMIHWSVNNIAQPLYSWVGNLAPSDSIEILIDSTFLTNPQATYNYLAYVVSVNSVSEINTSNDTVALNNISYFSDPIISFSGMATQYCENDVSVNIAATPTGGSFSGTAVSGTTFNPSIAPIGNTTVYYQVTNANGCTNIDSTQISITSLPTVSIITPIKTNYCNYENVINLNAFPSGGTFSGTGVTGSTFDPSTAGIGSHNIVYSYTDGNGCSNKDTVQTAVSAPPTASISSLNNECANTLTTTLTGGSPSGGKYQGYTINPNQGVFFPQIAGPGLFTIDYIYTDINMCSDTAHTTLRVVATPDANFSIPSSSCINDTVSVNYTGTASSNAVYTFNFDNGTNINGSGAGPYQIQWTSAGIKQVSLSVSDSGCVSNANTKYINIISTLAMITPQGLTNVCYGDTVILNANSGTNFQYQWFDANGVLANDTLLQLKVSQSGSYFCLVTPPTGCAAYSNTINVSVKPQLVADYTLPTQACQGDTVNISFTGTAPSTANYNWNFDGANIISGSGNGPYSVVWTSDSIHTPSLLISEAGCYSNIKQKNINIIAAPAIISALGNTSFCDGGNVNLIANGGPFNYQWYNNSQLISGANSAYYMANQSGNYSVNIVDTLSNCVSQSNAINVVVNTTNFNIAFMASPTSFTSGPFNTSVINQTPNMSSYYWDWEFGDGNTSSAISPSHTYNYDGQYSIRAIAQNITTGCYDTLEKTNYINCTGGTPNPCTIVASITPSGYATLCIGDSINLTATAGSGYSYQWVFNSTLIPNSDTITFKASQAGLYSVIISDSICSKTSQPFMLNNYPSIQPVIFATGSIQPCSNDSMMLSTSITYSSYNWNTGSTNSSIYVKNTGYYQVSVVDNYNCTLTSAPYSISNSFLSPPEICIVGTDTNNYNRIIWERQSGSLIDSFYVYRESTIANQYDKIGAVPFTSTSLFVDSFSNPNVRAYRYRIAAVDTCGGVTLMGNYHKTIHLTINAGLNGSWNLIWDGYTGFNFGSYRIYRGTSGANMSLLAQLPSTANSYTDLFPPSGTLYYEIEVINPNDCYPDSLYTKGTVNYNSSRSNRANNGGLQPQYLTADFSADIYTGQWPIKVHFTDNSMGSPDAWAWDFGDGNTSIEQNPSHTYNNTGLYTVSLKICNGTVCDTVVKTGLVHVLPNGIIELSQKINAKVYPNPNNGLFTLEVNSAEQDQLDLQIFNSLGELVYQEQMNVSGTLHKQINLNYLSNGVYFIRLQSSNQMIMMQRLIIQK
jgi:PKD repeat protein